MRKITREGETCRAHQTPHRHRAGAPCPNSQTSVSSSLPLTLLTFSLASTSAHAAPKTLLVNDYGAKGDGTTLDTAAIQKAIDTAAPKHETVSLKPGTYLTGALFLKSGVTLDIPEGVTLTGSQDIKDFPDLPTRIAGIEMTWPAALINVRDQHDVTITGKGTIDENGAVWWKVYRDPSRSTSPKGLRWASDYDAKRVRLLLFQNSYNVHLGGGITLKRSGFWTVQILYSHDVTLDGVIIRNNEGGRGPSTDGIDIDSSHDVEVSHADIDVNDDALCLKAGRDSDGLRVNRPTYNVKIPRLHHPPRSRRHHHRLRDLRRLPQHRGLEHHRRSRRPQRRPLQVRQGPRRPRLRHPHPRPHPHRRRHPHLHDHELEPQPTATPPCPPAPTPKPSHPTGSP